MEELIARVVAARQAAEAEHIPPHGGMASQHQQAAILIAQVLAILGKLPEQPKPVAPPDPAPIAEAPPAEAPPEPPAEPAPAAAPEEPPK